MFFVELALESVGLVEIARPERDPLTVTTEDLHAYLAGVFREFENPYTRFSRVKALKLFFGWSSRKGLIAEIPARDIKTPRTPEEMPYILRVDR